MLETFSHMSTPKRSESSSFFTKSSPSSPSTFALRMTEFASIVVLTGSRLVSNAAATAQASTRFHFGFATGIDFRISKVSSRWISTIIPLSSAQATIVCTFSFKPNSPSMFFAIFRSVGCKNAYEIPPAESAAETPIST